MNNVIAGVDGAGYTQGVCDYAAWAAKRLDMPLRFLHMFIRDTGPKLDASGSIGLGAHEALLQELVELDQRRNTLAREHGRLILDAAKQRALTAGVRDVSVSQRHGELVEALIEVEREVSLYVLGQHDYNNKPQPFLLDHNLESAIRALHRPILVAAADFTVPKRCMIAFDGSATARRMVEVVADGSLLQGLECTIAMVGANADALHWAVGRMADAGFQVKAETLEGEPADALTQFAEQQQIDMLVMGAYGHSRIRQWVIGSTTTALLRRTRLPVFILR